MGGGGPCKSLAGIRRRLTKSLNNAVSCSPVGRYFKLEARGTTFTTELRAGAATFLTMAYIISVNAAILADSGATCSISDCTPDHQTSRPFSDCRLRPDPRYQRCLAEARSDLMVATAVSSMVGCLAMGLLANLPLALAPGMGANTYFAYNLVGFHGTGAIPYSTALAVVLVEGCVFLLLSVSGLRSKLARLIPRCIRLASAAGIGLFLAFVGLQQSQGVGLVGPSKTTLVTLAACRTTDPSTGECTGGTTMQSPTFWLGFAGFLLTSSCMVRGVKGSIIYGIVFVTSVSWFRDTAVTAFPDTPSGDAAYAYFRHIVDFRTIRTTAGAVSFSGFSRPEVWAALATLLYVDVLDTTGTMYSLAELGGFTDERGRFEGERVAFVVDAGATIVASALGSSTVATYVESTAGIQEGGRTGVTAVTVGCCFLGSLFFAPVLTSVPAWAIGPALVTVGGMMMRAVKGIEWGEAREAVPAFVTMAAMPLTYSIANGIIGGMAVYVGVRAYEYMVGGVGWLGKAMKREGRRNQVSATAAVDVFAVDAGDEDGNGGNGDDHRLAIP